MKPLCEQHDTPGRLVTGRDVYPHRPDLFGKKFWVCTMAGCDARCGCHLGTDRPLGVMATAATRKARMAAHKAFDATWKEGRRKWFSSRRAAYEWLRGELGMKPYECHIGSMGAGDCEWVVEAVRQLRAST